MGIFDRLRQGLFGFYGGPDDPRLSGQQNIDANRSAVLNAGLQTILSADQPGIAPLAAGVLTGRQTGQATRQGTVARNQAERMAQMFNGGEVDISTLQRAFGQAVAAGDSDMARSLSEVLKASIGATDRGYNLQRETFLNPETGQNEIWNIDPRTGQRVGTQPLGIAPPPSSGNNLMFGRENTLVDNYRQEVRPIEDAYRFIDTALADKQRAIAGDGAARTAMLYAFVKALDPTSVVREGEARLAQEALPIWQRAQGFIEEITQGKSPILPTPMVEQMVGFMERMQGAKEGHWQEIYDMSSAAAQRWGVDPAAFRAPPSTYRQRLEQSRQGAPGSVLSGRRPS